jgi:hypothetical protein
MATASGFNDPTAQRLEPITTGAEPHVVGPLLADVLHDPRWLECDVALISGGKSNLTYRVACYAGEVVLRRPHWATSSLPRTTWCASTASCRRSTGRPCRCRASCTSALPTARSA